MDFLAFFVGLAVGWFLGWRVNERIHQAILPDMLKRLGVTPEKLQTVMGELQREMIQDEPTEEAVVLTEIPVKVEQHGSQLYIFRKEDDQFLGQGGNFDDIIKRLEKDFQNVKFTVTKEDGADLLKKDPAV